MSLLRAIGAFAVGYAIGTILFAVAWLLLMPSCTTITVHAERPEVHGSRVAR